MKRVIKRMLNNSILSISWVWNEGNSVRVILTGAGVSSFSWTLINCQNVFPSVGLQNKAYFVSRQIQPCFILPYLDFCIPAIQQGNTFGAVARFLQIRRKCLLLPAFLAACSLLPNLVTAFSNTPPLNFSV